MPKKVYFLAFLLLMPAVLLLAQPAQEIVSPPLAVHTAPLKTLPPLPPGPLLLTDMTPERLTPQYWINRLPDPDAVLKTPEELVQFNKDIRAVIKEQVDVFGWTAPAGSHIRSQIRLEYDTVSGRILFDVDGHRIPKRFFESEIRPRLQINHVPDHIHLRYGAAVRSTSVRALPTETEMIEGRDDIEFDQLQFSRIKLWTPVSIIHQTKGGSWYYVQAPYVRGWARAKDIALFTDKKALKKIVTSTSRLVVTSESIQIDRNTGFEHFFRRASMGTVLPLEEKSEVGYRVRIPVRGEDGRVILRDGFISPGSDVHVGYLVFTQRNIINQAFKLLGARYGWGGMYKGRDCSGFTHDVFLTLGVDFPRDSKQQGQIGTPLGHFTPFEDDDRKEYILTHFGTPGITLLRMSLHMMLYLGDVDGKHYIIHSTWAERIGDDPVLDEKKRINQVVVTDMSLNGRSYLGSLFNRTISMNKLN